MNHDTTACKRDLLRLNSLNQSHRNSSHKQSIYTDEDDRSLKYYKLGKSAQNILKEPHFSLKRELSPIKFRETSYEKKVLNQKLIDKFAAGTTQEMLKADQSNQSAN